MFKRENRYLTLKLSDATAALGAQEWESLQRMVTAVAAYRKAAGKPGLECVVVESDWPIYDRVWQLVEGLTSPDSVYSQLSIARQKNAELLDVLSEAKTKVISSHLRTHGHTDGHSEPTPEDWAHVQSLNLLVARIDKLLGEQQHTPGQLVRYCFECGSVGEVGPQHLGCCPEGRSDYVHPKIAEQAHAGFRSLHLDSSK